MDRHAIHVTLAFAVALTLLAPQGATVAAGPEVVIVDNFPQVQKIAGSVTVGEPVPQTRLETRTALVSPAPLADTNHLTDGGFIDTAGFSHITLSLAGSVQGSGSGAVGVVLLPEVAEVKTALRSYGVLQFPLRVEALAERAPGSLFSSESATFRLAFPRYRVLFYNATPHSAEVTVFAYLGMS
jgi:hypothetical protein